MAAIKKSLTSTEWQIKNNVVKSDCFAIAASWEHMDINYSVRMLTFSFAANDYRVFSYFDIYLSH